MRSSAALFRLALWLAQSGRRRWVLSLQCSATLGGCPTPHNTPPKRISASSKYQPKKGSFVPSAFQPTVTAAAPLRIPDTPGHEPTREYTRPGFLFLHQTPTESDRQNAMAEPAAGISSLVDLIGSLPEPETTWGPGITSETTLNGVPYAPFSKSDKLGRMADWTDAKDGRDGRGRQQYNRNYRGGFCLVLSCLWAGWAPWVVGHVTDRCLFPLC